MARTSWNESTLQFTLELNGVGMFDEQIERATKTHPVRSTAIALTELSQLGTPDSVKCFGISGGY